MSDQTREAVRQWLAKAESDWSIISFNDFTFSVFSVLSVA